METCFEGFNTKFRKYNHIPTYVRSALLMKALEMVLVLYHSPWPPESSLAISSKCGFLWSFSNLEQSTPSLSLNNWERVFSPKRTHVPLTLHVMFPLSPRLAYNSLTRVLLLHSICLHITSQSLLSISSLKGGTNSLNPLSSMKPFLGRVFLKVSAPLS